MSVILLSLGRNFVLLMKYALGKHTTDNRPYELSLTSKYMLNSGLATLLQQVRLYILWVEVYLVFMKV